MPYKTVLFVIILNLGVVLAEVYAGLISGSLALLSDAGHNAGDVLALVVTFIALYYGARSANERMTFGYVRAEMMAAFINALFLCVTMAWIAYESVVRFFNPEAIRSEWVMVSAFLALLINGISAFWLHKADESHHHDHEEKHGHDLNIRSAYLHMLSDALISLGVIAGALGVYLTGVAQIDSGLSLVFALYILKESFWVLRRAFFSLIDANRDDFEAIQTAVLALPEVHSIHDLHLYRPSSSELYCSMHLVLKENYPLEAVETILEKARKTLKSGGVTHSILQPETLKYACDNAFCCRH